MGTPSNGRLKVGLGEIEILDNFVIFTKNRYCERLSALSAHISLMTFQKKKAII